MVFTFVIRLRSYWIGMSSKSNMTDVLIIKGKNTETQGRRTCDDVGRDWGDIATNQRMPRIVSSHQKLEQGKKEFFPRAFQRHCPSDIFCWTFTASRTVSEYTSVDLSHSVCGSLFITTVIRN